MVHFLPSSLDLILIMNYLVTVPAPAGCCINTTQIWWWKEKERGQGERDLTLQLLKLWPDVRVSPWPGVSPRHSGDDSNDPILAIFSYSVRSARTSADQLTTGLSPLVRIKSDYSRLLLIWNLCSLSHILCKVQSVGRGEVNVLIKLG